MLVIRVIQQERKAYNKSSGELERKRSLTHMNIIRNSVCLFNSMRAGQKSSKKFRSQSLRYIVIYNLRWGGQ